MIQLVDDPWPQNTAECAVFSVDTEKSDRKYFVRLNDYNFQISKHDLIELRNRINGVLLGVE